MLQEALLEVIEDYFCSNYQADFEGEDSDDDSINEDAIRGESMLKIRDFCSEDCRDATCPLFHLSGSLRAGKVHLNCTMLLKLILMFIPLHQ